jgi:hypothetical protein
MTPRCPPPPADCILPLTPYRINLVGVLHHAGHSPSEVGDPDYNPRLDLTPDGVTSLLDVLHYLQVIPGECTST